MAASKKLNKVYKKLSTTLHDTIYEVAHPRGERRIQEQIRYGYSHLRNKGRHWRGPYNQPVGGPDPEEDGGAELTEGSVSEEDANEKLHYEAQQKENTEENTDSDIEPEEERPTSHKDQWLPHENIVDGDNQPGDVDFVSNFSHKVQANVNKYEREQLKSQATSSTDSLYSYGPLAPGQFQSEYNNQHERQNIHANNNDHFTSEGNQVASQDGVEVHLLRVPKPKNDSGSSAPASKENTIVTDENSENGGAFQSDVDSLFGDSQDSDFSDVESKASPVQHGRSDQVFDFEKLPVVVRASILKYLLACGTVYICNDYPANLPFPAHHLPDHNSKRPFQIRSGYEPEKRIQYQSKICSDVRVRHEGMSYVVGAVGPRIYPEILRVSKALHKEGAPILYSEGHFHFGSVEAIRPFLYERGKQNCQLIQSISIQTFNDEETFNLNYHHADLEPFISACDYIVKNLRLKSLRLAMHPPFLHPSRVFQHHVGKYGGYTFEAPWIKALIQIKNLEALIVRWYDYPSDDEQNVVYSHRPVHYQRDENLSEGISEDVRLEFLADVLVPFLKKRMLKRVPRNRLPF
ncbi:MAG: hypothetical protein M1824_005124 [Vezdaea acicularis]|nr:MAG: hypothetical protein M1824_005124 [Vezdaea acicularis]